MRTASPGVQALARRLVQTPPAAREGATPQTPAEAGTRSWESLRNQLEPLVGGEGFRALLSRALVLAQGELPWLRGVQADAAGSLTGLDDVLTGQGPNWEEVMDIAVLAHLLGLLVLLVGAKLTRQLVSSAWPDTPVQDADFDLEEGAV